MNLGDVQDPLTPPRSLVICLKSWSQRHSEYSVFRQVRSMAGPDTKCLRHPTILSPNPCFEFSYASLPFLSRSLFAYSLAFLTSDRAIGLSFHQRDWVRVLAGDRKHLGFPRTCRNTILSVSEGELNEGGVNVISCAWRLPFWGDHLHLLMHKGSSVKITHKCTCTILFVTHYDF